ncbi:substrate-binding domain-containing protein [Granulosicoccus antarcticus]|uniref:HTH-type transcriptional regulator RafR n=1 Tax=Granulosicoccus antarcticus IMCC3135 TaxID=1192854 RepID=A0A2Z2NIF7_9GAMM|nr:substrate-binding domain-containing protein [Granulosicoccus antarcticus]ASJ71116.1 HTH-type transcriptional regulator RafR [Granulosicoccus antarcticus IMCC3135]
MNLKELAELLKLSQATVSRALNGYPEVREATRQRVLEAAQKYNYRPNTRAMGLATGKAMTIGHIIPTYSQNDVVNPVFGEFIAGASQTYSANGYELLLTVTQTSDENQTYRNLAAKGAVDGVIIHSPRKDDSRVQLLQDIGLPFVIHGRVNDTTLPYSWIDTNNRRAFNQATRLLIDLGHQRIALINGPVSLNYAWLRQQGYEQAMQAAGLPLDSAIMIGDELTETHGYRSANQLLNSEDPPSAFLVSSYVVALGVRRAIAHAGLSMGKDVSVIIHDDELSYFQNNDPEPQFTATRSSVRQAGVLAARMLLDIIDDPSCAPLTELLEAQLTIGASTGPLLPSARIKH